MARKSRREACFELRREIDFGHQQQHLPSRREGLCGGMQVDLGLAAAGHAMQQVRGRGRAEPTLRPRRPGWPRVSAPADRYGSPAPRRQGAPVGPAGDRVGSHRVGAIRAAAPPAPVRPARAGNSRRQSRPIGARHPTRAAAPSAPAARRAIRRPWRRWHPTATRYRARRVCPAAHGPAFPAQAAAHSGSPATAPFRRVAASRPRCRGWQASRRHSWRSCTPHLCDSATIFAKSMISNANRNTPLSLWTTLWASCQKLT